MGMAKDDRTTTLWAVSPRMSVRPRVPALVALGDGLPAIVVVESRELVVGRGPDCSLRLAVRGVSREHAKLVLSPPHTVSVIDLRSRNGTFVNGRRIEAAELAEGDELHFGPLAQFRFTRALEAGVAATTGTTGAVDLEQLSARERDVANLVADGLTNAAIADRLGIRPRTVATHLEHIFAKLAIGSRAELIRRVLDAAR